MIAEDAKAGMPPISATIAAPALSPRGPVTGGRPIGPLASPDPRPEGQRRSGTAPGGTAVVRPPAARPRIIGNVAFPSALF